VPRAAPDPAVVAVALQALRDGSDPTEVAALAGVTVRQINRWRAVADAGAKAPLDTADADDTEEPPLADDAELRDQVRWIFRVTLRAHRRAIRTRDARAAQTLANTLAKMGPLIARLERELQADDDAIRVPRAEFEAAARRYRERVATLTAQPLVCSRCGAALRAEVAGVGSQPQAPAPAPGEPRRK
jgi:hypothetical protein